MLFTTLLAQGSHVALWFRFVAVGGPILLVVAFLIWGLANPNVGRMFARIFAVLGIGLGVGVLCWGIVAACLTGTVRSPFGLDWLISDPSEAIGWGAGFLAAGVTALVLSFVVGCKKRVGAKKPPIC